MKLEDNPIIRRTLLPQPEPDPYAEPRARLWSALRQFRERAAVLANEIHRDLPEFTVHDITHLDALWEMADLIAGPEYPINPLEAFALGGVFLLHDLGLGLAAWPGGLEELKKGPGWGDALSTHLRKHLDRIPTGEELASPPPEIERAAVADRLRILHSEQAERLALASFPANPKDGDSIYHLIDDPDLRQAIGSILGKIAHSHWWPVSRLGNELGMRRGALPDGPREWDLDPLKIAVLLRTADAAHLDARRAPGFLWALRQPEGLSGNHWCFQNHLLKPCVVNDRLVYTTARPFPIGEADAWWLCEETLRMVDRELDRVDALLADLGRPRLQVHRVAGTESPDRLRKYVEVSGWTPVDARIHVSNVADLAKKLGGASLYGRDPHVPLRELIQNASDAVRARRILQGQQGDWGRVTVRLGEDDEGAWVEVEDTGIGMSEAVLKGPLLDFGTTYWGSTLMKEEHEGLWASGFEPTGRFGIGFFSVFMWGRRVRVTTRRFEDGRRETRILEFQTGIEARPIVRPAEPKEQLQDGGTRVRIWLNKDPNERSGILRPWRNPWGDDDVEVEFGALCAWIAPALEVDLYVEDEEGSRQVVGASDWTTMNGVVLLSRISLGRIRRWRGVRAFEPLMNLIQGAESQLLGRAAIYEDGETDLIGSVPRTSLGVVTVGGLRANDVDGIAGIILGSAERVTRDWAIPLAPDGLIAAWATEQAALISKSISDPSLKMACAAAVLGYGGDPLDLPIAKRGEEFFNQEALAVWKDVPDQVILCPRSLSMSSTAGRGVLLNSNVLCIYEGVGLHFPRHEARRSLRALIKKALATAWGCDPEQLRAYSPGKVVIGTKNGKPEESWEATIIRKPQVQKEDGPEYFRP